jgi:hypothetical protein
MGGMLDRAGFRRHAGACRYYREDWNVPDALYRCYCLLEMPPATAEEQQRCMTAHAGCWRFKLEKPYTSGRQRAGVAE